MQINILLNIQDLSKDIINRVDTDVKGKKVQERIGNNVTNLNNITSFLLNLINEEELPQLKVAYNFLTLEERPDALERISEILTRFENLQPNVL